MPPLESLTDGYGMSVEQVLDISCQTGSIEGLLWVIQQQKKLNASFDSSLIVNAIEKIVTGGFDSLLLQLRYLYDIYSFDEAHKEKWIDLALAAGFPTTVRTLQQLPISLSPKQQSELNNLIEVLNQNPAISPPAPINTQHDEAHGGKANYVIYEKEYRKSVSYVLYHLRKEHCDFRTLIENLGHRRRHMAGRGKVCGLEMYGVPTAEHTYTYFDSIYASYGKRIQKKYSQLPITVIVHLNGTDIHLTEMTDVHWVHPNGDFRVERLD